MSSGAEIVDIGERIADHFPLGTKDLRVELVVGAAEGSWVRSEEPVAVAVVRMIVWETNHEMGTQSARDIKEQEVAMGWPVLYDDHERVAAFFRALARIIDELVDSPKVDIDCLMPVDLMCTDALKLARARSQADFDAALRTKRRLGQYLPPR